jgi:large subunit ribosomal protein L46
MNTWVVGHVPAGHHVENPPKNAQTKEITGSGVKTFFMKGRIMAGQADLSGNSLGLKDFRWLTKEETRKVVDKSYWSWVQDMLADR